MNMSIMDKLILGTGQCVLLLIVLALVPLALWLLVYFWGRAVTSAVGAPIVSEAIREYKQAHPEALVTFNKLTRFHKLLIGERY